MLTNKILFIRATAVSSVFQKVLAIRVIRVSLFIFFFLIFTLSSNAQTTQILTSDTNTSIRGLSVVNDKVLWASGSNGTVARSVDGGKTFNWMTVTSYEQRDFRDVEAFDANTAIIMAIAEPAIILKTKDGGQTWKKVFEDSTKGMFLDAMDFGGKYGVVVGDPIEDKMFTAVTEDSVEHWMIPTKGKKFTMSKGEAFFASSGTNIKIDWNKEYKIASLFFVTGGTKSRLFFDDTLYNLNITQGKESTGANSIAINSKQKGVIVGGDFSNTSIQENNCVLFSYKGKNVRFSTPKILPHGYRSCVEFITDKQLVTCGTSGIDISNDGGINWTLISTESYHVCQKAKDGNAVFLAGKDGRIAKLVF